MRTRAGLLLAVGLVLAGCGGFGTSPDAGPSRSPAEVAEDEDASAAEVVAAGHPFDADAADDGSRLVLYRVVGESGESVKSAWRLYGPDGEPVAQAKGGSTVLGLGNSFWLGDVVVGTRGGTRTVPTASEPLAPRPGDLVANDFEVIRALRPHPPTLFSPLPAPDGFGQGWTLDAEGRQWYQRVEPEEVLVGGPDWRQVRAAPHPAGRQLLGFGITTVGDHVVLPVVQSAPGDNVAVTAIAVRRADAPPDATWTLLPAGPVAAGVWELSPSTFALDDRSYVFSDLQRGPYVLDVRSGDWSALSLPTDQRGWELEPGRDGLYAFSPSREDEATDAWFSPDRGATWQRLSR